MNFWNTVKGQELANILIHELPRIAEGSCREQYVKQCSRDRLYDEVSREIAGGAHVIASMESGDSYIIIYEI